MFVQYGLIENHRKHGGGEIGQCRQMQIELKDTQKCKLGTLELQIAVKEILEIIVSFIFWSPTNIKEYDCDEVIMFDLLIG